IHPLITRAAREHQPLALKPLEDNEASRDPAYVADGIDQDCDGGDLCYTDLDGDGFGASAAGVTFSEGLLKGVELLCTGADAPTVTQGSVTGCTEANRGAGAAGGQVDADFGALPDGGVATLTFRAVVQDSAQRRICNGGLLGSATLSRVLSNDPFTVFPFDATCIDMGTAPAELEIVQSFELVDDADGDGAATPGDRVRVIATVENAGGGRDAAAVVFNSTANSIAVVPSSVTTTQGSVISGQAGGDAVAVDLGTVTPSSPAVVSFEADLLLLNFETSGFRFIATAEGAGVWSSKLLDIFAQPGSGAFSLQLEVTMRDVLLVDADGDGFASAGDTLRYEVELTNQGGRNGRRVVFVAQSFQNLTFVPGSVVSSQGGNAGSTSSFVQISIGDLRGLGLDTVNFHFDMKIDDVLPSDLTRITLRASVDSDGLFSPKVTDDPDTPEPNDPTVTPVPQLIFGDGFESGDVGAWSTLIP
ncbi:MAG: hypothetical protein AAFY88_10055, partial [Acidobacteriota bacterium]